MIKVKIEKAFQSVRLVWSQRVFYLALWWPRTLWGRGLFLVSDSVALWVGPLNVQAYKE